MILITGATGYIGRHLVARMVAQGKRFRLDYHSTICPFWEGCTFHQGANGSYSHGTCGATDWRWQDDVSANLCGRCRDGNHEGVGGSGEDKREDIHHWWSGVLLI